MRRLLISLILLCSPANADYAVMLDDVDDDDTSYSLPPPKKCACQRAQDESEQNEN